MQVMSLTYSAAAIAELWPYLNAEEREELAILSASEITDPFANAEYSKPQRMFRDTEADICIYGGSAGSGKSFALLTECAKDVSDPEFAAVVFRRTTKQITNPGSLWDAASKMYEGLGTKSNQTDLEIAWPGGGKIKFAHLEHEKNKVDWAGAEIPLVCFDELTHFTESQFFFLMSRNRSMWQGKKRIRATCNPDADSWVAGFIAWWIDQETGIPIDDRSGVLRWFIRINGKLIWGDSKQELLDAHRILGLDDDHVEQIKPKSITFVKATIFDNVFLLKNDPGYLANLRALDYVEQARLLGGNWKIRPAAGLYFQREWCEIVDAVPAGCKIVRYWDLASTEKLDSNDPDWTVGIKLLKDMRTKIYYVVDARRLREGPLKVEQAIINTAKSDSVDCKIGLPQDPGQAGKSQAQYFVRQLEGFTVKTKGERGDKVTRFGPVSSQCAAGNVKFLRGHWNEEVFKTLEGFPDAPHDDDADALAGAFAMYITTNDGFIDYLEAQVDEMNAKAAAGGQPKPAKQPTDFSAFG